MKQLSIGKYRKKLDKNKIEEFASELNKSLGGVAIKYKRTRLPVFISLWPWHDVGEQKASKRKANMVIFEKKGKKILEFVGSKVRAGGYIFEENLSKKDYRELERIAKRHHIFTFESTLERFYNSKVRHVVIGLCLLGLVLLPSFASHGARFGVSPLLYVFVGLAFAVPLFLLFGGRKYVDKRK